MDFESWYNSAFSTRCVDTRHMADCEETWRAALTMGGSSEQADRIPFSHAELRDMINRRAQVEEEMLMVARGARVIPSDQILSAIRDWAQRLGTPTNWRTFGKRPEPSAAGERAG